MSLTSYQFNFVDFPSGSISPGKLFSEMQTTFSSSVCNMDSNSGEGIVRFYFDDQYFVPSSGSVKTLLVDLHDGKPWPKTDLQFVSCSYEITTTSTKWTKIHKMTLYTKSPGEYDIYFDGNFKHSKAAFEISFGLFINEILVPSSVKIFATTPGMLEKLFSANSNQNAVVISYRVTNTHGNIPISIFWKTSEPTAMLTTSNLKIERKN